MNRNPLARILGLILACLSLTDGLRGEVRVVTTIPDLKSIVEEIGGAHVKASAIAKGTENAHAVALRPSHLVQVNKADLFCQVGLSLEHAYVPTLLEKARNTKILPGSPGFVNCSDGWKPIQVPEEINRANAADVHPQGNPHMNLDPASGEHMADRILEGLLRVDPENAAAYRKGHAAFLEKLSEAKKRWAAWTNLLKGQRVCVYHRDFDYFTTTYGIEIVDTVEPKPGLPPNPSDLAKTIEILRKEKIEVILTARWSNNRDLRFVAEKSGARIVELPTMANRAKGVTTWIGLMDTIHKTLAEAFAPEAE